ncbi:MAG: sensor histidine kinase [Chlorobiaceae bacterium]
MNSAAAPHQRILRKLSACSALYLLLLFICALTPFRAGGAVKPLMLDRDDSYGLAGHMESFVDVSETMTLERLLAQKGVGFKPLKNNLNAGAGHKAVWVRITMVRLPSFPAEAWLQLYPSYLENVDLYVQEGSDPSQSASYRRITLGSLVPVAERPMAHPEFVAPVRLNARVPCTIYLRLHSHTAIAIAGAMHTISGLSFYTSKLTIITGGYLIMCLVLTLVNILIYIRLPDAIYIIFSAWIFTLFCSLLSSSGVITLLLPEFAHHLSGPLYGGGLGIGGLLFTALAMQMFETKSVPALHRALLFMLGCGTLSLLVLPIGRFGETVPFIINAACIILLLFSWQKFRGLTTIVSGGMIFFVAYAFTVLAYMVQFMHALGWIPMSWWDINALYLISIADMILMFLAFLNRLHAAEEALVQAAKGSEQKALKLAGEMTLELRGRESQLELSLASERLALEEQRRFLSMLSHEYRTPLSVIRGNIDIIEVLESGQDGRYRDKLDAIHISLDRLVEVMEVSLERSRVSDDSYGAGRQRILLASFLSAQIANARALWPRHVFNYSEPFDEHHVIGDPQYLKTALFNLLDNACKYSLRKSPIAIDYCTEEGEAVIRIENQAKSPIQEDVEEFFLKYRRGKSTANTSGAGVGLWLVRQIIMQQDGRVTLEKSSSGVVATVRLPLAEEAGLGISTINIPEL